MVVPQNEYRRFLAIQNTGTNIVTLGFDAPAVLNTGWVLAVGGELRFDVGCPLSALNAITTTGTTTVAVIEGY